MASKQRILRLKCVDEQGNEVKHEFCLLGASQTSSNDLDLKLLGTEGEEAFVTELKHIAVGKYKTSDFSGPAQAWENVLLHTLSPRGLDSKKAAEIQRGKYAEFFEDLELVCTVSKVRKTSQLELIWRSTKGKIKTLGKIILPSTEEEEIALFDWTAESVAAQERQRQSLEGVIDGRDARIKELESQLESLVEVKRKNEEDMLEKFCLLLNEKKAKIRELQVIVADGSSGPVTGATGGSAQPKSTARRNPAPSKPTTTVTDFEDSESDDAFESAPVSTPSRDSSEDEAPVSKVKGVIGGKAKGKKPQPRATEPKEEEEAPKRKPIKGTIGKAKGKATDVVRAKPARKSKDDEDESSDGFEDEPPASRTRAKDDAMDVDVSIEPESELPPPRRELPFTKKNSKEAEKPQKAPSPELMEDSETDDEL